MTVFCNGRPAQVEDLLPALVNYFLLPSKQVRGPAVQGPVPPPAWLSHAPS